MTTNIWQVAAGDGERNYSDVFLQFGVMLIGPGTELGNYRENEAEYRINGHRAIRLFAEAEKDDLVVLKGGKKGRKWEVLAVGKIKSEYSFEPAFGEVEGFQLQHCRQVEWRQPTGEKQIRLNRGRFSHVNKDCAKVELMWKKSIPFSKLADPIPKAPKEVGIAELKRIADKIKRLQRLAKWYEENAKDYYVSEHETRTFLIVPLIMSLGWIEKQVKIELGHMDVVLFAKPYSKKNKPVVIIESKRLWNGLGDASEQVMEYAKNHPTCKKLVVSDGIRYKLYTKPKLGNKWPLSAYLNLLTPTLKHPYERGVEGAVSFLLKMKPDC